MSDKAIEALRAVKALEWLGYMPGVCVFWETHIGCDATDGRGPDAGPQRPRPHVENCPMRVVNAALEEVVHE